MKAFILGAGLGTRLRPLTNRVPKPLVPVYHRPLATYALDCCLAAGAERFAVNTHHLPEAWGEAFPEGSWRGAGIEFFHEPALLETGGGIKNIEGFVGGETLVVCNGDILTDFPIGELVERHRAEGNMATLGLRSHGAERRVRVEGDGRVTDLRSTLTGLPGTHQFTGIYVVEPGFLDLIPAGKKISVIPAFLELAKAGRIGSCVADDCYWHDLGNREAYLAAHAAHPELGEAVHPGARVAEGARVVNSAVGPGAVVEAGAEVANSVLWAGSHVLPGAELEGCVVCSPAPVSGSFRGADFP